MKSIRILLLIIGIPVGAFALFLLYATLSDYAPEEQLAMLEGEESQVRLDSAHLDLLIWNIGYGGLDASMDFFYDGGEQMRPERSQAEANLEGIVEVLAPYKHFDFILLQEVDLDSKRSYHQNQVDVLQSNFPLHQSYFAKNYDVSFVPIPLKDPMGKVTSGLLSFSKHAPKEVHRYAFPGNYSWPVKLFMLDRCFLLTRIPLHRGRDLVVINTHNSAYDDGSLRKGQMDYLRDLLLSEYQEGNYVVVGGDWNQTPYGLEPRFPRHVFDTIDLVYVEEGYPEPGWDWAYDPELPTNRRVSTPYDQARSRTTLIDYYLLSPNMEVLETEALDVDFRYSDHQPVRLKVQLR